MASKGNRKLLVPVDETSDGSVKVFDFALDQIYKKGDKVHLLHCIPPGQHFMFLSGMGMEDVLMDYDDKTKAEMEKEAREMLNSKFVSKFEDRKIPYEIEVSASAADAVAVGDIICKRAKDLDAMVVMGKHPKGKVEEFFSGSSTNYCVKHCKQPVLILHCEH